MSPADAIGPDKVCTLTADSTFLHLRQLSNSLVGRRQGMYQPRRPLSHRGGLSVLSQTVQETSFLVTDARRY